MRRTLFRLRSLELWTYRGERPAIRLISVSRTRSYERIISTRTGLRRQHKLRLQIGQRVFLLGWIGKPA